MQERAQDPAHVEVVVDDEEPQLVEIDLKHAEIVQAGVLQPATVKPYA
jgi:hypothetical protein